MATRTKKSSINIDLSELISRLSAQFQGLDFGNPSAFPAIPRYALLLVVALVVLVILWFIWLNGLHDQLNTVREQETKLRQAYTVKLKKAVNLNILREQKKKITQYVDSLEKQLPGKSEMDALLSDINQAGLERNLQFDLFKPGNVVLREYYAELPIALKITGRYHSIGQFAADVAALSRIVTLNELNLTPADKKHPDQLTLNATARTFRYLDPDEIQAQHKAKAQGGKK
jgi:type IV pilus assembly protein PilO